MSSLAGSGQQSRFEIWSGVYASFADAKRYAVGDGFEGREWRERSLAGARTALAALRAGKPLPHGYVQRSTLLPPVAATLLASTDPIRVLDFGGGLGVGYMTLLEAIPAARQRVVYSIVEVEGIRDAGAQLHGSEVAYLAGIPEAGRCDLVHSASAMQYIEDWKGLTRSLAACEAPLVLLSDVFAGPIPTFATLQNYYGSRIPHWFLNLEELLYEWRRSGYELVMRAPTASRRLDVDDILPMNGFPATHRLERTVHLLLARRG